MVKRKIPEVDDFLRNFEFVKDRTPRSCHVKGCKKVTHGFGIKGGLGYGFRGGDRVSCKQHKLPEHVEQNQQCIYLGCELRGKQFLGDHKFCAEHLDRVRSEGGFPEDFTVREKHKKCEYAGCKVAASYDGDKHCKIHAKSASSDDKRRCEYPGCSSGRPTFGYDGQKKTRCKEHREKGMYSRKLCEVAHCKVSASYGASDDVARFCNEHKGDGHTLSLKTCAHDDCERQPSFGANAGSEATHCSKHKPEGFVDVRNKLRPINRGAGEREDRLD